MDLIVCSICGEPKNTAEFSGKYTFCKSCHNEKRRNTYKSKVQEVKVQDTKDPKQAKPKTGSNIGELFFERILQLQQITFANGLKDIDGLQERLYELQDILDKIKEGSEILIFKVKISSTLSDYLRNTYSNGFDLEGARNMLEYLKRSKNRGISSDLDDDYVHFTEVYGIDPVTLDKMIGDELKDLSYIVRSFGIIYLFMIDYYNDHYHGDPSYRKKVPAGLVGTDYNCETNEIIINNPLRYDRKTFLEIYKQLIIPSIHNMGLHGIIEAGYPKRFLEILLPE